jgi:hypothetical protein
MKKQIFGSLMMVAAFLVLPIVAAHADNLHSGFALFNQTGGTPDVSVQCGANKAVGTFVQAPFTMYITMTNTAGTAGSVEVKYRDGTTVDYAIPAGTTLQIDLAAGSKKGTDNMIEVTGANSALLVGQASLMTQNGVRPGLLGNKFCTTTPFGGTPPF